MSVYCVGICRYIEYIAFSACLKALFATPTHPQQFCLSLSYRCLNQLTHANSKYPALVLESDTSTNLQYTSKT